MKGFGLIVLTENIGLQSVSVKMQIFVTGLFFSKLTYLWHGKLQL